MCVSTHFFSLVRFTKTTYNSCIKRAFVPHIKLRYYFVSRRNVYNIIAIRVNNARCNKTMVNHCKLVRLYFGKDNMQDTFERVSWKRALVKITTSQWINKRKERNKINISILILIFIQYNCCKFIATKANNFVLSISIDFYRPIIVTLDLFELRYLYYDLLYIRRKF